MTSFQNVIRRRGLIRLSVRIPMMLERRLNWWTLRSLPGIYRI